MKRRWSHDSFSRAKGETGDGGCPCSYCGFVKPFKLLASTSCLLCSSPPSLAGIRHETSYQNKENHLYCVGKLSKAIEMPLVKRRGAGRGEFRMGTDCILQTHWGWGGGKALGAPLVMHLWTQLTFPFFIHMVGGGCSLLLEAL